MPERVRIGAFGELRSEAMTVYPTVAEHVHAHVSPEVLGQVDEGVVVRVFGRRLADTMITYGIVVEGEDLYCAEPHGLDLWHGSLDDARRDAVLALGFVTTHFCGELHDAMRDGGEQAVYELVARWAREVS